MAVMLVVVAGCAVNTPDSTPAPNGQINVPGVSIQVYAPGPNLLGNTADANGLVAGIGLGVWHGIISPVTLVISFFNNNVQMYEVHNNGNQYNLGFLFGVAIVFGILGLTAGSRRRR
jgi:hypothetical protein